MIDSFRDLRVTVMGLGSFGGGIGAVRFLVRSGARVTVTDLRRPEELQGSIAALSDTPPDTWHLGGHTPHHFEQTDLVVASPAVPPDSPWLGRARAAGVPITSEIELFWERQRGRVVAVTGSNGKSTTTTLLHRLLETATVRAARVDAPPSVRVWLGGNIGQSLLPLVEQIQPQDWVVLELSSFQLETLDRLHPSPHVSVVTNFTPNHLDRHHTLAAYRQAKQTIARHQTPDQFAVRNLDDPDVATWPTSARRVGFGLTDRLSEGLFVHNSGRRFPEQAVWRWNGEEEVVSLPAWVPLAGRHNLANALAASAAARLCGADWTSIENATRSFRGLPHRLELAAECRGVRFYNDSKATTPEAAALALEAFAEAPLIPLVGGYDKQIDLCPLVVALGRTRLRGVVFLGQTGPELERRWRETERSADIPSLLAKNLPQAVGWCRAQAHPGDVVLLSPGCASHDWFRNYEERGDLFRELVRQPPGEAGISPGSSGAPFGPRNPITPTLPEPPHGERR
jgi:UDP-N-acetylmuramoylalanine--D-glutamate ligase